MHNFAIFCFICMESAKAIAQLSSRRENFHVHRKSTKKQNFSLAQLLLLQYMLLGYACMRLYVFVAYMSCMYVCLGYACPCYVYNVIEYVCICIIQLYFILCIWLASSEEGTRSQYILQ